MFNSDVLEVGVGMALLFAFMSLIATALCEAIENFAKLRSKELLTGIKELLEGGAKGQVGQFVSSFYNHPVIASLYTGDFDGKTRHLPSYIPRKSFSLALVDMIAKAGGDEALSIATLRKSLESSALPDRVKEVVKAALDTSGDNLTLARRTLEECFDATMDRVSGWYKRHTGYRLLAIGVVAAVGFNVDAIVVAQRLTTDKVLRAAVVERAETTLAEREAAAAKSDAATEGQANSPADQPSETTSNATSQVDELASQLKDIGYPIGWTWDKGQPLPLTCVQAGQSDAWRCQNLGLAVLFSLPGWLITALAIMLGAPFWFDILNKFMVIRSTVKPSEKSPDEPSQG